MRANVCWNFRDIFKGIGRGQYVRERVATLRPEVKGSFGARSWRFDI